MFLNQNTIQKTQKNHRILTILNSKVPSRSLDPETPLKKGRKRNVSGVPRLKNNTKT